MQYNGTANNYEEVQWCQRCGCSDHRKGRLH